MDRLGFLKRIGIIAGASLIPDWAIHAKPVANENSNIRKVAGDDKYAKKFIKKWKQSDAQSPIIFTVSSSKFNKPFYGK